VAAVEYERIGRLIRQPSSYGAQSLARTALEECRCDNCPYGGHMLLVSTMPTYSFAVYLKV